MWGIDCVCCSFSSNSRGNETIFINKFEYNIQIIKKKTCFRLDVTIEGKKVEPYKYLCTK